MDDALGVVLSEYREMREHERSLRTQLHTINAFAIAVISGLLVGIGSYKIDALTVAAPFILYLIAFQWSSDAFELMRVQAQCRTLERDVRNRVSSTIALPTGYEEAHHAGQGTWYFLKYGKPYGAAGLFYHVIFVIFLYMLLESSLNLYLRYGLFVAYSTIGVTVWFADLVMNKRYWMRSES